MGWVRRDQRRYYYRSVRIGDCVRSVYLGTEATAAEAFAAATVLSAIRRAEADAWQRHKQSLDNLDARIEQFDRAADLLGRLALLAAGYHQHKQGEWRKRRALRARRSPRMKPMAPDDMPASHVPANHAEGRE